MSEHLNNYYQIKAIEAYLYMRKMAMTDFALSSVFVSDEMIIIHLKLNFQVNIFSNWIKYLVVDEATTKKLPN